MVCQSLLSLSLSLLSASKQSSTPHQNLNTLSRHFFEISSKMWLAPCLTFNAASLITTTSSSFLLLECFAIGMGYSFDRRVVLISFSQSASQHAQHCRNKHNSSNDGETELVLVSEGICATFSKCT